MKKKILVFKIGAIGDILMTTPFLRELRGFNENSQIDFLVGKNCSFILNNNSNVSNVISFDQDIFFKKKFSLIMKLANKIKTERYDEIYILDKHWFFSFFSFLTRIKKRVGFFRDNLSKLFLTSGKKYFEVKHEIDYYLSLINISNVNKKLDYTVLDESKIKSNLNLFSDYIVLINDGGVNGVENSGIRMLPDNKFKELVEKLSEKNKIYLVGGPNLKKYYNKFISNSNVVNVAGCSIDESFIYLKYAKRVYTTDCGPMHMAACVNKNITCFFGPTNPKRKAPFVSGLEVVWGDEDIYDVRYELFGDVPVGVDFFSGLIVGDLK